MDNQPTWRAQLVAKKEAKANRGPSGMVRVHSTQHARLIAIAREMDATQTAVLNALIDTAFEILEEGSRDVDG